MFGIGKLTTEFVANPQVDLQATTPGTVQSGHINVSGTVLAGTFYGSSGGPTTKVVSGWATSPTGFVFGGDFRTNSVDGRGIFAAALATTGSNYGGDFRSASVDGRGIFGYATSPSGRGIGGDFRSDSTTGTGVIGRTTATTGKTVGGSFLTASSNGIAIQAGSTSTNGATYAGVFDTATTDSTSSAGLFRANGTNGNVVAIQARVTASGSFLSTAISAIGLNGYGGNFSALSDGGWGIRTTGDNRGIYATSTKGTGVEGISSNANNYGTRGYTPSGGTGAAVYAQGVLAASGTKTMRIDHPDDPENKYLLQYCAEGDTPQLQYRGVVKLDASGNATVALPRYFDKINRDPSYQLTAIGAPMPNLYVAQKAANNEFKIAGGKAFAEVSWTVIGIRNDRFVQQYGAKTEIDKPDEAKGTYLMPELYNKAAELREGYSPKENIESAQPQAQAQVRAERQSAKGRSRR